MLVYQRVSLYSHWQRIFFAWFSTALAMPKRTPAGRRRLHHPEDDPFVVFVSLGTPWQLDDNLKISEKWWEMGLWKCLWHFTLPQSNLPLPKSTSWIFVVWDIKPRREPWDFQEGTRFGDGLRFLCCDNVVHQAYPIFMEQNSHIIILYDIYIYIFTCIYILCVCHIILYTTSIRNNDKYSYGGFVK